jgi:single-stranded-DNA-specific exonuclease
LRYKLLSDIHHNPFDPKSIHSIIFQNREIEDPVHFMIPSKKDLLDPFLLDNIQDGITLLMKHLEEDNHIFIIVDSDVDGYTSAAILYNYIKRLFPQAKIQWMVHEAKEHGINIDLIPKNTKLLICPDSSSNEYEKHAILKENHIDVLVIDHHDAPYTSPNAIVINNHLSKNYENKWLSGAGVVFKFCEAIDILYKSNMSHDYLDLAALGIIADMMDVRTMENRYIIQEGLRNINNPFFKALIERQKYSLGSQSINAVSIMFYISPPINAVTRVGTMEEKETLFSAFIKGEQIVLSDKRGSTAKDRETIADKAVRYCLNAKNRQKKIVDEIKENVEANLIKEDLTTLPLLLIKLNAITNRNLTGLVANQLANKYKRPVLLLVDQGNNSYLGSGRNYGYSEIHNLKDCLQDTNLFDFAEGHQSAFGAKIDTDNMETFTEQLRKIFPNVEGLDDTYIVDFIFNADDFKKEHIREIVKLSPLWGKGFDEPLIVVKNIPVDGSNLKIMGKRESHLKFEYNDITFVKFHVAAEEINQFRNNKITINVIGRCNINIWQDSFTYQVLIQDYNIIDKKSEFVF